MGSSILKTSPVIKIEKVWGYEIVMVNNGLYCSKLLVITPGMRCSMHYHPKKHETFYLFTGKVGLDLGDNYFVLEKGHAVEVPPFTQHRFSGLGDLNILIETSMSFKEDDSVRLEPSGKIPCPSNVTREVSVV